MAWTKITRVEFARRGGRYSNDLTDREWALISPFIPPARRGGRPHTSAISIGPGGAGGAVDGKVASVPGPLAMEAGTSVPISTGWKTGSASGEAHSARLVLKRGSRRQVLIRLAFMP